MCDLAYSLAQSEVGCADEGMVTSPSSESGARVRIGPVLIVVFALLMLGGGLVTGAVGGALVAMAWLGVAAAAVYEHRQRMDRLAPDERRAFRKAQAGNWAVGGTIFLILAVTCMGAYANVGGPLRAVAAGLFLAMAAVLGRHSWQVHRDGVPG
jgi:Na+/proline symporter